MNDHLHWIQYLNLKPHPEGGFFRETYRANLEVDQKHLPFGFSGNRKLSTSIYYLLRSEDISRFHRLHSDELWYYHYGSSLKVVMIDKEGNKHTWILGARPDKAEKLQVLIPAGTIFGAEVIDPDSFSLMGCMVSPGFEFDDFDMFDKEELLQAYPKHAAAIEKFTK
ncbi:MAG: cupin domain-containing protein [Bacteroidales bacterium]|jgi:predicted cupin superfamily sugar epimerase